MRMKYRLNILSKTLLLSLVTGIAGCTDLDFNRPKAGQDSKVKTFASDQFTVEVVGSNEPNNIGAQINISDDLKSKYVVRRISKSNGTRVLVDVPPSQSFLDSHLTPHETYTYEVGTISGSEFAVVSARSVTIPEDLEVRGQMILNAELGLIFKPFRVFIRPGASLITNGQTVRLETSEVISENGTIETFDSGHAAQANQRGRSGGTFSLNIGKLTGHLNIVMRGETGGQGSPGNPGAEGSGSGDTSPTDGSPGTQGAPGGNSGVLHLSIREFKKEDLTVSYLPGLGGQGGPGGKNGEGHGGGYAPNGPKGYEGQVDPQDSTESWR